MVLASDVVVLTLVETIVIVLVCVTGSTVIEPEFVMVDKTTGQVVVVSVVSCVT